VAAGCVGSGPGRSAEPSLEPVSSLRVSFVSLPFRVRKSPEQTHRVTPVPSFCAPAERGAPRTLVTPGPSLPQPSASPRGQRLPSVPGRARACVSLSPARFCDDDDDDDTYSKPGRRATRAHTQPQVSVLLTGAAPGSGTPAWEGVCVRMSPACQFPRLLA
jgi:hypothetical protein